MPFQNDNLFYSPFLLPFFKASIHCVACQQDLFFPSVVSVGESLTTFMKGDCHSCSVRGNTDRLGRRHKLLVGGQTHYFFLTKQDCAGQ
jgi:hypothetical protein